MKIDFISAQRIPSKSSETFSEKQYTWQNHNIANWGEGATVQFTLSFCIILWAYS